MQSTTPATHERHPLLRVTAEVLVLGMVAALVLPIAAFAGKGQGRGADSTTSLNLIVLDGPDTANHNDRVTFESDQTETDRPFVGVRCYQDGNFVLDGYVGVFADYMFDPWVTLGSDYWAAGAGATCNARMFYFDRRGREKLVATTTFVVQP
jgi:hypothetical protein